MDVAEAALYNLLIIKKFSATGAEQQIDAFGAQVCSVGAVTAQTNL